MPRESQQDPPDDPTASILREFSILNKEDSESSSAERFHRIVSEASQAADLVNRLFPSGIPVDGSFFEQIREFRRWISYGGTADEAIGHFWVAALNQLDAEERLEQLCAFADEKNCELFADLDSIQVVVKEVDLPVEFLANWFEKLLKRIERDLAQRGFWKAVRALCEQRTDNALKLVCLIARNPTDIRIRLASVLIGSLRGLELNANQHSEFERIELFFRDHADPTYRSCFNWSWATTACDYGLTDVQLHSLIDRGESDESADADSLLGAACRILRSDKIEPKVWERAFNWISEKVSPHISRDAKYHVVETASLLQRSKEVQDAPLFDCSEWLVSIQPISPEDAGTWHRMEGFLVTLLKADPKQFSSMFLRITAVNASAVLELMKQPQGFDWLTKEMGSANVADMIGRLMMSINTPCRRLGLYLFNEIGVESIPEESFNQTQDVGIRLLFHEMQRNILHAETIARIFVSLIPNVEQMDDEFRDRFKGELALQARNFAGGCRDELERIGGNLLMVKETTKDLATYFEEFDRARQSGIAEMEVAGAYRAGVLQRRRMSQHINSTAEEHSVMLKLCKKVQLLYGRASSAYINGDLQDSQLLSQFSESLEVPFVDFCDPEEMAMRRIYASLAIEALIQQSGEVGDDA